MIKTSKNENCRNSFIVGDCFKAITEGYKLWMIEHVRYDDRTGKLLYGLTNQVEIIDGCLYRRKGTKEGNPVVRSDSDILSDFMFYKRVRKVPKQLNNLCNYCPMHSFDSETCNICEGDDYREEWDLKTFFLIGDMCMKIVKGASGTLKYGLGTVSEINLYPRKHFSPLEPAVFYPDSEEDDGKFERYSLIPYYSLVADGIQRDGILCCNKKVMIGTDYGDKLKIYLRRGELVDYNRKRNLCTKACVYSDCLKCKIRNI